MNIDKKIIDDYYSFMDNEDFQFAMITTKDLIRDVASNAFALSTLYGIAGVMFMVDKKLYERNLLCRYYTKTVAALSIGCSAYLMWKYTKH